MYVFPCSRQITCLVCYGRGYVERGFGMCKHPVHCQACNGTGRQTVLHEPSPPPYVLPDGGARWFSCGKQVRGGTW